MRKLAGQSFLHDWQLRKALEQISPAWKFKEQTKENELYNKGLQKKLDYLILIFQESKGE